MRKRPMHYHVMKNETPVGARRYSVFGSDAAPGMPLGTDPDSTWGPYETVELAQREADRMEAEHGEQESLHSN